MDVYKTFYQQMTSKIRQDVSQIEFIEQIKEVGTY